MLLLASLFVSILGLAHGQCPFTYSENGGICYRERRRKHNTYIGTGLSDIISANAFCVRDGAILLSNLFGDVRENFVKQISAGYSVLTGMRCQHGYDYPNGNGGGSCTWMDGTNAQTPYAPHGGAGDCVLLTQEVDQGNRRNVYRYTSCDVGASAFTCQMQKPKACPDEFILHRGQCIFLSNEQKKFVDAEADCVSRKGHIVRRRMMKRKEKERKKERKRRQKML